jgi:hypothetical protein
MFRLHKNVPVAFLLLLLSTDVSVVDPQLLSYRSFCVEHCVILLTYSFRFILSKQPVIAQFGIAGGNRKGPGTNFQDLQDLAKLKQQQQATPSGAGTDIDTESMQNLWKDALSNPDYMNTMGALGEQFGDALEQMLKLSPEELSAQIEAAMKLMTDGDIVENIVNEKDEVIKSLEASGAVSAEELARYKADPAYFELKMRESFEQMGSLLQNPEYINKAAEVMKDMSKLMSDPDGISSMMKSLMGGAELPDDDKIEETRLQFLAGDYLPGFKEVFETPDMQVILKDPVKWKETVLEGFAGLLAGNDDVKTEL